MKNNKLYKVLLVICAVFLNYACSDEFLNQPMIGAYDEVALSKASAAEARLIGVYANLNGGSTSNSGMLSTPWSAHMGSTRGGESLIGTDIGDGASWEFIAKYDITPTSNYVIGVMPFYYNAIGLANGLIAAIPNISDMDDERKLTMEAEARFLRAHFYFLLKRYHGYIPWVDETNTDVRVSNADENGNYIDIWPKIEADMQFAIDNLPDVQTDKARVNSWAAKAYMARIRMEQKKYDITTYNLVKDVIDYGVTSSGVKYQLMPNYHDNFDPSKENNSEGVFMVSISVNTGVTRDNNLTNPQNQWTGPYKGAGVAFGWAQWTPSQWYVDHFRINPATGTPYLDYYETEPASVKADYGMTIADPFVPETKPLDPRLDWSVGRRGIPYLGWGVIPSGTAWQRDATGLYSGPYIQKKWMYDKKYTNVHNTSGRNTVAIDGLVIRFADVLLLAAELEVRVNQDLDAAKDYVNLVRARAANQSGWVMNEAGTDFAANYRCDPYLSFTSESNALDAILHERMLELGLEGQRFYDVVRFGGEYIEKEIQDYLDFQGLQTSYLRGITFDAEKDIFVPFGQSAMLYSSVEGVATLKQIPGY